MGYKSEVLADSPVLYLDFHTQDEADNRGSRTDLTVDSTGVTTFNSSFQDSAPYFAGPSSDDHIAYTLDNDMDILNGTSWTIELWFKRSASQTSYADLLFIGDGTSQIQIMQWINSSADARKIFARYKDPGNGGALDGVIKSTSAYTDTNWHHVVLTSNGTTVTLYIDGTSQGTDNHFTQSFGATTKLFIGAYAATSGVENWYGNIDEVAIYDTALSSTRVTAHYNAMNNIDALPDAAVATASSTMPDPTVIIADKSLDTDFDDTVNVFTAGTGVDMSASTGDLVITSNNSTGTGEYTTDTILTGYWLNDGAEVAMLTGTIDAGVAVRIATDRGAMGATVGSNKWIRFQVTSTGFKYRIWDFGTAEGSTWTTGGTAGGYTRIYLGINEYPTSSGDTGVIKRFLANETGTVDLSNNAGYTAEVGTATGLMVDPAVSTGATHSASPATASGEAVDPTISLLGHANIAAETFDAYLTMPGGAFSEPAEVTADVATASGLSVDVTVSTELNAIVRPTVATGSGYAEDPVEARDPLNDPYFLEIRGTTDTDDRWYRLDETSGTSVLSYTGGTGANDGTYDATFVGTVNFNIQGPEGRRAVNFDGGYISRAQTGFFVGEYTFEAVIRTTESDGVLFFGSDYKPSAAQPSRNYAFLEDGKVHFLNGSGDVVSGFTNIADGEWHHLVIAWGEGNTAATDNGVRVYLDGQLEIRREIQDFDGSVPAPDYFFGMPDSARITGIPANNFIGDVMEVVFRVDYDITQPVAQLLYYAAMGIVPIEAGVATASGVMVDPEARGNQKRALVLYFYTFQEDAKGASIDADGDFDFGPLLPTPGTPYYRETAEMAGYRLFYKAVDFQGNNGANQYRDPVTDLPRLLDLETDIDVEDYDLIIYRHFPNEGSELDIVFGQGHTQQALEAHVASVRAAVDKGVSLWVSEPYLATMLGIIEDAAHISTLREDRLSQYQSANQYWLWDEHASVIDPWVGDINYAYQYLDTHRNNRERVVAAIDGLTDIPSTIVTDALLWTPYDIYDWNSMFSFKYEDRPNGLLIGDDYLEPTMLYNDQYRNSPQSTLSGNGQYRKTMYAVPADAVKAGTVVTRLGSTVWAAGNVEVANPYADYAGTIVVEPGDTLNGTQVGGKILLTLSEDPRLWLLRQANLFRRQLVPDNSELSANDQESAEKREWDYSTRRWYIGGGGGSPTEASLVPVPDGKGGFTFEVVQSTGGLNPISVAEKYPVENVTVLSMIDRGLVWLGERPETSEGDVVIRTSAATGSGTAVNASASAQSSTDILVTAAIGVGTMVSPVGFSDDVTVAAFPATGSGYMNSYVRLVEAGAFEGSGVMVEPSEVVAERDFIVVTVYRPRPIQLYLEEN